MPGDRREQNCGQCFNRRIASRDVYTTIAATSAQNQIAKDGDVVVGLDCRMTLWASGIGKDDRLFEWNAVNDDVEEAADDGADRAHERANDWQRHIKGAIYRRHDHPQSL